MIIKMARFKRDRTHEPQSDCQYSDVTQTRRLSSTLPTLHTSDTGLVIPRTWKRFRSRKATYGVLGNSWDITVPDLRKATERPLETTTLIGKDRFSRDARPVKLCSMRLQPVLEHPFLFTLVLTDPYTLQKGRTGPWPHSAFLGVYGPTPLS